jgi:hypothetical protein
LGAKTAYTIEDVLKILKAIKTTSEILAKASLYLFHRTRRKQKQISRIIIMSHSGSEFEQVGWSDLESLNGGCAGGAKGDEAEITHVEVELPSHLLYESRAAPKTDQSSIIVKKIPGMDNLKINSCDNSSSSSSSNNNGDDDDDDDDDDGGGESSAWSHGGGDSSGSNYYRRDSNSSGNDYSYSGAVSTNSVAASSTISGFDIISLSGATERRCNRCSFLNGLDDGVCGACGVALVANPCMDTDDQIAKNLQLKEEAFAFASLQADQKKRKSLAQLPILARSQVLASDVVDFVKNYEDRGFRSLSEASLVVLASRFIDCADACMMTGGKVSLAYHFSEKHDGRMTQIRQDGLGPYANVSTHMEAAYTHPNQRSRLTKNSLNSSSLPSIPESDTIKVESFETDHLGWIVVTTEDVSSIGFPAQGGKTIRVSSDFAVVQTLTTSNESLPLVCFGTSLRNDDMVRRLWNGLYQICIDFFQDNETFLEQQEIERMIAASSPRKKPRPAEGGQKDEEEGLRQTLEQTTISSCITMPEPATSSNILGSEEQEDDDYDVLLRAIVDDLEQTRTISSPTTMPEPATSSSATGLEEDEEDDAFKDDCWF